jgi:DNA-directed RNA polymerase I, II, and III subunit RPABC3
MASTKSNVVFDDIFSIEEIDPGGKKYDRGMCKTRAFKFTHCTHWDCIVSRLHAKSRNYGMELSLDYNCEIFPLDVGMNVVLALASSLARDPVGTQDGIVEEDRDRDVWRPDGKGRRGVEDEYDYVMYGRVYRFDPGTGEVVYVPPQFLVRCNLSNTSLSPFRTAYASFGGLLMSLTGSFRHMTNIVLGDPVFLLMRK